MLSQSWKCNNKKGSNREKSNIAIIAIAIIMAPKINPYFGGKNNIFSDIIQYEDNIEILIYFGPKAFTLLKHLLYKIQLSIFIKKVTIPSGI